MLSLWLSIPSFSQQKALNNNPVNTFPSYQEVVKYYFDNYQANPNGVFSFSRRPDGWYLSISSWQMNELKETEVSMLWTAKSREYQKLKLPSPDSEQSEIKASLLSASLKNAFMIHPYYGYNGWDRDVITAYGKSKKLSDSLLYGLGRAYSNMAQAFLRPQYQWHSQNYPAASYEELPAQRADSFIIYVTRSIRCFDELSARNPQFQTIVGSITLKAANEYMYAWLSLISVKEKRAKQFLKDRLYPEFFLTHARNYLNNCDSNAILFTGGDMDTYPLLYVQEKESYRKDVSIINLSLLNTAWYADMVKDRYPNIKMSLNSSDYSQKLDYAYLMNTEEDSGKRGYQPVNKILMFLASSEPETKLSLQGQLYPYIPTPYLLMPVDFKHVIRKRTVPAIHVNQIEEQIRWQLPGSYVTRSQILMLDIISAASWEYPVYWSAGVSDEMFCGLEDYTSFEGLIYRLIPLRFRAGSPSMTGYVFTQRLQNIFSERFNLKDLKNSSSPEDESIARTVSMYRYAYARQISALIDEKKKWEAREAVLQCDSAFPVNQFPYHYTDLLIIECCYKAGHDEKGDSIARSCGDYWVSAVRKMNNIPANHPLVDEAQEKIGSAMHILETLISMLQAYERNEIAAIIAKESEKIKH